ncbi:MAG: LysR family transcriptional regulator [Pseudomonadales bacterium]
MALNEQVFEGIPVFCAVVEAGSLTAAAQNLGHSASYISKALQRLEQRLNCRLLNRTTRALNLTPEGQLFYERCRQLIHDAEQAQAFSRQLEPAGLLRVSAPVSFGVNFIRPLLADYFERYPKVQLELDLTDRKVDLVREGLDVAIRATMALPDSSLVARKLASSNIITVASPEYLAQHGALIHPSELAQRNCICYSLQASEKVWHYSRQGEALAVNVQSNLTTNNGDIELGFALDHLGVARMPSFIVGEHLTRGRLVELFTEYERPQVNIFALYGSRKHPSASLRTFVDYLFEHLKIS